MKLDTIRSDPPGFNTSPINAAYVGIISHNTLFDLKDEPGFIPVEEYASQSNVMDGEVGAMDDVRFVMTTNAKTFSSTVTVHGTMILASDFYGISRISGEALKNIIKPPIRKIIRICHIIILMKMVSLFRHLAGHNRRSPELAISKD